MADLNDLPLPELYAELHATGLITRLLQLARDEDLGAEPGAGDVTSLALVPGYARGRATVRARPAAEGTPRVLAGLACADELLTLFQADVTLELLARDGQAVPAQGCPVLALSGSARSILAAERTLLNLLGRLSGIASRAAAFVRAVAGTRAAVHDTRKTTPGMRVLEKYAVRCGGARCHRLGLYDAALIKDNHLAALGALGSIPGLSLADEVRRAVSAARDHGPRSGLWFAQMEADTLDQLRLVLEAGGCGLNVVLLDNMTPDQLRQAVAMRDAAGVPIQLEASGGITLESALLVAQTGVERLSVGSITHGAVSLDLGLDWDKGP